MKPTIRLLVLSLILLAAWSGPVHAQDGQPHIVSLYRVAPGQHIAFLQWMADQDAAAAEAGAPVGQWYAHLNGDSWDFLHITLEPTDEQAAAADAAAQARGLKIGAAGAIELRQYMTWHTDTYVAGPMTAAELLAAAQGN